MNTFLAEQAEKQTRLRQLRVGQAVVKTKEVSVQCANQTEPKQTAEAAVQTDFPAADIMEDLKRQVDSLSKIVEQLTQFKAQETLKHTPSPFSDRETLCDITDIINQDPPAVNQSLLVPELSVNRTVPASDKFPSAVNQALLVPDLSVNRTVPASDKFPSAMNQPLLGPDLSVNRAVPASSQNRFIPQLSPANPHPQLRSPLSTIDSNAQLVFSSVGRGPTDEQKRKVEAIVIMSAQMIPAAMACINVLFSEEELANGNTSGSNGYKKLDNLKLCFLESVLRQKYDSDTFREKWEDVKIKINTRCRGKRRTVLRRLQRQIDFD